MKRCSLCEFSAMVKEEGLTKKVRRCTLDQGIIHPDMAHKELLPTIMTDEFAEQCDCFQCKPSVL